MPIIPITPINPLFPPCLQPKKPYHFGEEISEMGTGTRFVGIEDQEPECYRITCHMDYTGIEFATWVAQSLVIDPDPQDVFSEIDQLGMLLGFWSGHL